MLRNNGSNKDALHGLVGAEEIFISLPAIVMLRCFIASFESKHGGKHTSLCSHFVFFMPLPTA